MLDPLADPNHRPEPANASLLERYRRSRLGTLNKDSRYLKTEPQ
jgi:hypothetical protein